MTLANPSGPRNRSSLQTTASGPLCQLRPGTTAPAPLHGLKVTAPTRVRAATAPGLHVPEALGPRCIHPPPPRRKRSQRPPGGRELHRGDLASREGRCAEGRLGRVCTSRTSLVPSAGRPRNFSHSGAEVRVPLGPALLRVTEEGRELCAEDKARGSLVPKGSLAAAHGRRLPLSARPAQMHLRDALGRAQPGRGPGGPQRRSPGAGNPGTS